MTVSIDVSSQVFDSTEKPKIKPTVKSDDSVIMQNGYFFKKQ